MADKRRPKWLDFAGIVLVCLLLYVLSSGPILAFGFWLRERTGWDGFYSVLWLYLPLFWMGRNSPIDRYIEWWVKMVGAKPPG